METQLSKSQTHYQKYKNSINKWQKKKFECECGCVIINDAKYAHRKSNKHKNLMEIIELKKKLE